MGIAVVKVSREALDRCLPIINIFGGLVSVSYPVFYGDPCDVRFVTTEVPEAGEHPVEIEMSQTIDGPTVTLSATLKLTEANTQG